MEDQGTTAAALERLQQALGELSAGRSAAAVARWRGEAGAVIFHLRGGSGGAILTVIGGTGTGKSTIVNRLLGREVSAASFRRTFTAGCVAAASEPARVPEGYLGLPREIAPDDALPARGSAGTLVIAVAPGDAAAAVTVVDTPDLDGDQPAHHAEADRAFRWAESVLFLVSPEKYQMTELLPYYRLARRYGVPALFVMNKCEESAVLEDYRRQLGERDWPDAPVFAVPRDDAAWDAPAGADLCALRQAAIDLTKAPASPQRREGTARRVADLMGRLHDQVLDPMRAQRRQVDRLQRSLEAMGTPEPGVDVSPVTRQLSRRLQEQSVLYLMGPGRIIQRVRQVPGMLVRLPRTAWDLIVHGQAPQLPASAPADAPGNAPDFPALVADQFRILQSRIDDLLRAGPDSRGWMESDEAGYRAAMLEPADAGRIAQEELDELKRWLEQRWNKAPRDTAVLQKLLKHLPGGKTLTKWSEAAPYLLTIVLATTDVMFGPVDLIVLGSYSLATWLGEKLSNEVTGRTRHANRRIADRYADLARRQLDQVAQWLDRQSPPESALTRIETLAESCRVR